MLNMLKKFVRDEEGQDLVEYSLLIAGIAVVVAAALPALATAITGAYTDIAGSL